MFLGVLCDSTCCTEIKDPSTCESQSCQLVSLDLYYFSLGSILLKLFGRNVPDENMAHCKVSTKGDHLDQLQFECYFDILVRHMDSNNVFVGQLVHHLVNQTEEQ